MSDDPPYDIEIINRNAGLSVDEKLLRKSVTIALGHCGCTAAHISIAVVTDQEMAELHQRFRGVATPTDVLAFDMRDDAPTGGSVEGEIVVSAETAARLAAERGHAADAEVALYAVHGILHLLGLQDDTPGDARHMHRLEDEILAAAGVGPVFGEP